MLQATLSNLLALKVMTALATLVLIVMLFFVRYLGKKLGRTKKDGMYDRRLLSSHRWAVGCAAFAGLVTVFLIERLVHLDPVSHRDSSLFRLHLAIDAALFDRRDRDRRAIYREKGAAAPSQANVFVLCVGGDFVGDWNLDARFTLRCANMVPVSLLKAPSI